MLKDVSEGEMEEFKVKQEGLRIIRIKWDEGNCSGMEMLLEGRIDQRPTTATRKISQLLFLGRTEEENG